MQDIYDMVIIGGGPAGLTAAIYAAGAGLNVILLEKMSVGGQMTLTEKIENYPGFEAGIDGFSLGEKMKLGAERSGAKTIPAEVISVDFSGATKIVKTKNRDYKAKTVVVAAGAQPRHLDIEGEDALTGRGVHYCAHCDGRFYKGKTVIVAGGGNSAAADAIYLSRLAKKVYIVHRRDSLRALDIYKKQISQIDNIELVFDRVIKGFITDDGLKGATLKNTVSENEEIIDCDGIFVSIGRVPSTGFLNNAVNLSESGHIIADETTRTNIEGVFAAGDIRTKSVRQIVTAVADGAAAAHFAGEYI